MQREQDEARVRELREELSRITQQLQDEQNKLLQQNHAQEKEREEYARSDTVHTQMQQYAQKSFPSILLEYPITSISFNFMDQSFFNIIFFFPSFYMDGLRRCKQIELLIV